MSRWPVSSERPSTKRGLALVLLGLTALTTSCLPTFEDRPYLVEDARVLAIRSTPAEVRPGEVVTYEALVVDPEGELTMPLSWSFCLQPRRAEERGAVTQECATGEALSLTSNPASVPSDACMRFGPTPPPVQADEAARRPVDPDASGGYAIPIQAAASTDEAIAAFGKTRIRCDLAGATRPVFDEFEARYTNNQNPELALVEVPATLGAGASVTLVVETSADAVEPYVLYVVEENRLRDVDESLSLRWYVSAGTLARGSETQRGDPGASLRFTNEFTAPSEAGTVHGWVVLTDERGGTSWAAFELEVQ